MSELVTPLTQTERLERIKDVLVDDIHRKTMLGDLTFSTPHLKALDSASRAWRYYGPPSGNSDTATWNALSEALLSENTLETARRIADWPVAMQYSRGDLPSAADMEVSEASSKGLAEKLSVPDHLSSKFDSIFRRPYLRGYIDLKTFEDTCRLYTEMSDRLSKSTTHYDSGCFTNDHKDCNELSHVIDCLARSCSSELAVFPNEDIEALKTGDVSEGGFRAYLEACEQVMKGTDENAAKLAALYFMCSKASESGGWFDKARRALGV